jgi:hypothetical protein
VSGKLRPARQVVLALLAAALTVAIPVASANDGPGDHSPTATHVTDVRADLTDVVSGDGAPFAWHFDYGTTQDYGSETATIADSGSDQDKAVTATVKGLQPATTYHARLAWKIGADQEYGDDVTFTTATADDDDDAEDDAPVDLAAGSDDDEHASEDGAPKVYKAKLGLSAVTDVAAGAVRVRIPGWEHSAPLPTGSRIPVGSILDTRAGTLRLTTALADGRTQTASFRGGIFELRQQAALGGTTDIITRPSRPGACASAATRARPAGGARAAATTRRPPRELGRLWAHDRGGRYRTHGANSVATVRGTSWTTIELCDATITRVSAGAVSVFDRRLGRRVLVTAGHEYRARKG